MRAKVTWKATVLVVALLGGLGCAPRPVGRIAERGQTAKPVEGLPPAAEGLISRTLGRDDRSYHARAESGSLTFQNPRHGLTARFDARGVEVRSGSARLGFSLRASGYGDALEQVTSVAPQGSANRVEYRRGPLTEWYANGPAGLEQGFTLDARPARKVSGPLTLDLAFSGTLGASVTPKGDALTFSTDAGAPALRYRGLTAFDADGRELPARLQLRAATLLLRVDDDGARYPLTIDPFVEQAKLFASNGLGADYFGTAVAISGDTIVVGATKRHWGGSGGAVYVFERQDSAWHERAELNAEDRQWSNRFGASVAVTDDTIVVGAPGTDLDKGAAWVFVRPPEGWSDEVTLPAAKLTAMNGEYNDLFGFSVAVSGDTVVVGAPANIYQTNNDEGFAYVFVKPASGWEDATETAKLIAREPASDDRFGGSVAISGDTVVVGARDAGTDDRGAAYVFVRPAAGWSGEPTEQATLTTSDGAARDFGASVAISGDTIVVGAVHGSTSIDPGSVYVFLRPASGWPEPPDTLIEQARLTARDRVAGDRFGSSVAISNHTIVVGALGADSTPGSAHVFVRPASGWVDARETKLTAMDGREDDEFGTAVAIAGHTIVVGAGRADGRSGPSSEGAAYVFQDPPSDTLVVNTDDDEDDGACDAAHCSLREAIVAANAEAGADAIHFDIAPPGPHTIQPTSFLPPVQDPVVIDGTTQPGFEGAPIIELNGSLAWPGVNGLQISAGSSTVRGLVINGFERLGHRAAGIVLNVRGNNVIEGNYIGTDLAGTAAVPNAMGIWVSGSSGNRIGGTAPNARNVISGNRASNGQLGAGIAIGGDADANVVEGNYIGASVTGAPLGNGTSGVSLGTQASSNLIGGKGPGRGNLIAFNDGGGVTVSDWPFTHGNSILGNSIHSNGGLGIDLGPPGVTPNDPADADTGANNLQNFPILRWVVSGVRGRLVAEVDSTPQTSFTLELFANAYCDESGHGEGKSFLQARTVTTNASGRAQVELLLGGILPPRLFTATLTSAAGNTSEFSPCVGVTFVPAETASTW